MAQDKNHTRTFVLFGLGVVVFLLVLGIGTSSVRVCSACHTMRPYADSLAQSSHEDVHCYSCHLRASKADWPAFKTRELLGMYPAELVTDELSGPGLRVSADSCLSCHSDVMQGIAEGGGLQIRHETCVGASTLCDECHGPVAHGEAARWSRVPVMEECTRCHRENAAPTECETCHSTKSEWERLGRGPWQVTHGSEWEQTHGMGSLQDCATCHPTGFCAKCHLTELPHPDSFPRTHGTSSLQPRAMCGDCHDQDRFCDGCHGLEMPHPDGFLERHSDVAGIMDAPECLLCHETRYCEQCHEKHVHPGGAAGLTPPPGGGG